MFAIGGSNSSDITSFNSALASVEMYTPGIIDPTEDEY